MTLNALQQPWAHGPVSDLDIDMYIMKPFSLYVCNNLGIT